MGSTNYDREVVREIKAGKGGEGKRGRESLGWRERERERERARERER